MSCKWIGRPGGRLMVAAVLLAGVLAPRPAFAASIASAPHVRVSLEAETTSAPAEGPVHIGLRFVLDPGWHVYWRHPGDSGLAPTIAWTLPPGLTAGEVAWPAPRRIAVGPLANYGYDGEVLLPVTVGGPPRTPGSVLRLGARASWLVCKEDCIPGSATLALELPVAAGEAAPGPAAPAFAAARARAERPAEALGVVATATAADARDLVLRLAVPAGGRLPAGPVEFFAAEGGTIAHAAPQAVSREDDGTIALRIEGAPERATPLERLRGVVVAAAGWAPDGGSPALAVDVPVVRAAVSGTTPLRGAPLGPAAASPGLLAALGLAAIGGLLLNLMPCVFPVLSIKILDVVRQAGGDAATARRHAAAYAAGVVVSMWVLAGALLALRAAGAQLGWGFQLQSPAFVVAMSVLLLALALNLLGTFQVGIGLTGVAGRVREGEGAGGAFVTGVLAVVVATPCTAPFMGTALAYALTLPAAPALLVFTALGAGMALPYVVLCALPGWLRWLPRPGAWLEVVKQALAFPLLAAVVWLVWVLAQQTGPDGVLAALAALLVVGLAAWLAGRAEVLAYERPRALVRATAVGLVLAALGGGIAATERAVPAGVPAAAGAWAPFSPAALAVHRGAGRPVFVDFTAAWCLTCQVNERLVLDTAEVQERFSALGVALLRADWTSQSPEIAGALAAHGRSSVPLYVLYGPGAAASAEILPSVLTRGIVLRALDRLANPEEAT